MRFKITDIITERSPFGKTIYKAIADDGISVKAVFPNTIQINKDMLDAEFQADYMKSKKPTKADIIKVGDIIGIHEESEGEK